MVFRVLVKVKEQRVADALVTWYTKKANPGSQAMKDLTEFGPLAESAALGFLKNRDSSVRVRAVGVLAYVGAEKSLGPLRSLAKRDEDLRRSVETAIEMID